MNRSILAGLVAAPLFLTGCQNTADQDTQSTHDVVPASNQVVLAITGMT